MVVAALATLRLGFKSESHTLRFGRAFKILSSMQLIGFVSLESIERISVGVPLVRLFAPTLWIGIGLQLLVAALASLVLLLLQRLARAIGRLLRTELIVHRTSPSWSPTFARIATQLLDERARSPRGPPQLLLG
ncbi:MAG: hypothetical protein ACYDCC_06730 [Actinomycetota bacterium]